MSASLVGSEMCIRDSCHPARRPPRPDGAGQCFCLLAGARQTLLRRPDARCLLYTSDAADDM
eukprot:7186649-Alexandrium_andersonii.AAC.1